MYYFVRIPMLPKDFRHQDGEVELIKYFINEGSDVEIGAPIALISNWWAVFELQSISIGSVSKVFFDTDKHKTFIKIGDPIAIINCSIEDAPKQNETAKLIVKEILKKRSE